MHSHVARGNNVDGSTDGSRLINTRRSPTRGASCKFLLYQYVETTKQMKIIINVNINDETHAPLEIEH